MPTKTKQTNLVYLAIHPTNSTLNKTLCFTCATKLALQQPETPLFSIHAQTTSFQFSKCDHCQLFIQDELKLQSGTSSPTPQGKTWKTKYLNKLARN